MFSYFSLFRFCTLLLLSLILIVWEGLGAESGRLLYNKGVELAAAGNFEEAETVLRKAAVEKDKTAAAQSLRLLGQIAAASAKKNLAEPPDATSAEQRQSVFDFLQSAEQSFSESLSLVPNYEVRKNLETLRAWRHNMTEIWTEFDRQQQRRAELQQRIRRLADEEANLIESLNPITNAPNSPQKFQTGYEASKIQKQLAEELALLKDVSMEDEKFKEQWTHLPDFQKRAAEAAEHLSKNQPAEALSKQQQVLDYLRKFLKQEENQQNQNQEQQNKDQNNQEQNQDQQPQSESQKEKQKEEKNTPQESEQNQTVKQREAESQKSESREKQERMLQQVRRKEQSAEKRREQLRAEQMQADPVEKDW